MDGKGRALDNIMIERLWRRGFLFQYSKKGALPSCKRIVSCIHTCFFDANRCLMNTPYAKTQGEIYGLPKHVRCIVNN